MKFSSLILWAILLMKCLTLMVGPGREMQMQAVQAWNYDIQQVITASPEVGQPVMNLVTVFGRNTVMLALQRTRRVQAFQHSGTSF